LLLCSLEIILRKVVLLVETRTTGIELILLWRCCCVKGLESILIKHVCSRLWLCSRKRILKPSSVGAVVERELVLIKRIIVGVRR